ncbi:MAG: hypothetical protein IH624_17990 [Phycisphaerae bacterium]|nr:hypothetical protein [Phycisphaerae bacterium]
MSLTRIVVLANSWKHHDWCIAGIDLDTGKWVRPVTNLNDGRVPKTAMKLDGYFPALLDVLDIPLHSTGPNYDFESENRTILSGPWRHNGRLRPEHMHQYIQRPGYILHNHNKYVTPEEMRQKPFEERITLQLIQVDRLRVRDTRRNATDKHNWKGIIPTGQRDLEVNITDPILHGKLDRGEGPPTTPCLVTMSLGMPYKPPHWPADALPAHWILIAGVIEIAPGQRSRPE